MTLEHAPPSDKLYGNPLFGIQATGNSNSVRAWWKPLRTAGASARAMLVQAAAQQWQVDPASCTASNGHVIHAGSGREISYGALVDAANTQNPPKDVVLKDPKDFVLIGKPLKRLDTPDKVNGKVVYGIDAMLPGMKFATLAGARYSAARSARWTTARPGKFRAYRRSSCWTIWSPWSAIICGPPRKVSKRSWCTGTGPERAVNSKDIWDNLRAASESDGVVAKSRGDIAKGLATGDKFEASYELPFLAHATMEPVNATVHLKPESCEIWTGTQVMTRVQSEAAKAAGLPVEKVTVNQHLLGGGFGRKLEPDMVVAAVRIAKHVDGPVKVLWTREEDIQHDVYRPIYRNTIAATLSDGKIVGWKYRVSGSSVMARWFPPGFQNGVDIDGVDSAIDMPYDIPNFQVEFVRAEPPAVPTGFWRGVGPNNNVFAIECFMDELARKAGKDPIDFRRSMLANQPRFLAALRLAAAKSNWSQPLPRESDAAYACNRRSQASLRPWSRLKSTSKAKWICAGSHRRSIPALPSIRIPSPRSSKAD